MFTMILMNSTCNIDSNCRLTSKDKEIVMIVLVYRTNQTLGQYLSFYLPILLTPAFKLF